MPKAETELVVVERTHELLVWTLKHIERFPRSQRYGVGLRLEERVTSILELILRAKYTRERLPLLNQANLEIELLRFQFRAVKDLLHPDKSTISRTADGARFLGYRVFPDRRLLPRENLVRFRRRLRAMQASFAMGELNLSAIRRRLTSWIGHAIHADTLQLRADVLGDTLFSRPSSDE